MGKPLELSTILSEIQRHHADTGEWLSSREWGRTYGHTTARLAQKYGPWEEIVETAKRGSDVTAQLDAPTPATWRKWVNHAIERKGLEASEGRWRRQATLDWSKVDHPVAVCFTADWHLGALGTDYVSLLEDFDYMRGISTDHLRLILLGDITENTIRFKSKEAELTSLPPQQQQAVMCGMLDEPGMGEKIACATWGNHDTMRDENLMGYSPVADKLRAYCPEAFFYGKGLLRIQLGKQEYVLRLTHQGAGKSIYNKAHDLVRMLREDGYADVFASAHLHSPVLHWECPRVSEDGQPREVWMVKVGTYKTEDGYSNRGWKPGVIALPTLVFYPDRHEIAGFKSVRSAVQCVEMEMAR